MKGFKLFYLVVFLIGFCVSKGVISAPNSIYGGAVLGNAKHSSSQFSSATAYRVFGGFYGKSKYFSSEIGYTSLGKMDGPTEIDGFSVLSSSAEITGYDFSTVANISIDEKFNLYAKLGIYFLTLNVEAHTASSSSSVTTTSSKILYGAGGEYEVLGDVFLRVAWETFTLGESKNIILLSTGIVYAF